MSYKKVKVDHYTNLGGINTKVSPYKNADTDSAGEEVAIEKVSKLFTPAKAPVDPVKPVKPVEPVAKTDETLVEQVKKPDAEIQKYNAYIKEFHWKK
jgi:hypothetical protein